MRRYLILVLAVLAVAGATHVLAQSVGGMSGIGIRIGGGGRSSGGGGVPGVCSGVLDLSLGCKVNLP